VATNKANKEADTEKELSAAVSVFGKKTQKLQKPA
jgi:hypothetical protein